MKDATLFCGYYQTSMLGCPFRETLTTRACYACCGRASTDGRYHGGRLRRRFDCFSGEMASIDKLPGAPQTHM